MAIPTPSFFKIRLGLIIIIAIVFVFIVGLVKQALAIQGCEYNDGCYAFYIMSADLHCETDDNIYQRQGSSIVESECRYNPGSWSDRGTYTVCSPLLSIYKWTGSQWLIVQSTISSEVRFTQEFTNQIYSWFAEHDVPVGTFPSTYWPDGPPDGECGDPNCDDEEAVLIANCGDGNYSLDPQTCEGSCIDPCWENRLEADAKCGVDHYVMDSVSCEYNCSPCDQYEMEIKRRDCVTLQAGIAQLNYEDCTVECTALNCDDEWEVFKESCGNRGVQIFSSITCEGICNPNCDKAYDQLIYTCAKSGIGSFDWNTCVGSCDNCTNEKTNCTETCSMRGGVHYFDCSQTASGTVASTCQCKDEALAPETPEEPYDPDALTDPESRPDPPTDPETEDPETTPEDITDEWLKSIKHTLELESAKQLQELTMQTDLLNKNVHNQGEIIKTLENVATNMARSVTNQGAMVEAMNRLANKGDQLSEEISNDLNQLGNELGEDLEELGDQIGEDLDEVGTKLDDLQEAINGEGDNQGALPYEIPEEYGVDQHSWSDRTSQFLTDMSSTGLFSVPTEFFDNIPGGGSPEFTIETGDTFGGTQIISFIDFSGALLGLRAVIQIAFMWLAVRIVTMKR